MLDPVPILRSVGTTNSRCNKHFSVSLQSSLQQDFTVTCIHFLLHRVRLKYSKYLQGEKHLVASWQYSSVYFRWQCSCAKHQKAQRAPKPSQNEKDRNKDEFSVCTFCCFQHICLYWLLRLCFDLQNIKITLHMRTVFYRYRT